MPDLLSTKMPLIYLFFPSDITTEGALVPIVPLLVSSGLDIASGLVAHLVKPTSAGIATAMR
jgi:hypothetical protein